LRQIVDDLLWLARADKPEGAVRPSEPADVAALAAELTERFAVVADSRGVALTYEASAIRRSSYGIGRVDRAARRGSSRQCMQFAGGEAPCA